MSTLDSFVPKSSASLLKCWIDELSIQIRICKPRRSKSGDFKVFRDQMIISVNDNLNQYSFLITLVHEIAHAFVYKKYKNTVPPHGRSWKQTFRALMLNFLSPEYFPNDILKALSRHMINPSASTYTDLELIKVLKRYNRVKNIFISDLSDGDIFQITSGKVFIRGKKIRKRYSCVECVTNKVYLFHPFTEVVS